MPLVVGSIGDVEWRADCAGTTMVTTTFTPQTKSTIRIFSCPEILKISFSLLTISGKISILRENLDKYQYTPTDTSQNFVVFQSENVFFIK